MLSLLTSFSNEVLSHERLPHHLFHLSCLSASTSNVSYYRPGNRRPPNVPEVAYTPSIEWSGGVSS